jgi:hypothetical protein
VCRHVRQQQGDVAGAGAHVEDAHARADPGLLDEPPRDRIDAKSLPLQAAQLDVGVPQDVGGLFAHGRSIAADRSAAILHP